MFAWAIELEATSKRQIFCVIAETKNEAVAQALDQLEDRLRKEDKDAGRTGSPRVSDYHLSLYVFCPIQFINKTSGLGPSTNSSFDEELRKLRNG